MKPLNAPLSAVAPASPSIGVCVPTIRRDSLEAFLAAWKPVWNALDPRPDLKLFVHEDRPERSQTLATAQFARKARLYRRVISTAAGN